MFIIQEKVGGDNNKSKKKWKLWRSSSEGSTNTVKKGGATVSDSSSLNAAVAVVVRAPPKNFMAIKQEWAAIRIQAVFRAFLVTPILTAFFSDFKFKPLHIEQCILLASLLFSFTL